MKTFAAGMAALLGIAVLAICFAGYLTPAALLSVLSGLAFCD